MRSRNRSLAVLKKNVSASGSTRPEIWPGPMYSITSRCSTTDHVATATWAISVPRRLNAPGREAGICLLQRGQSTFS